MANKQQIIVHPFSIFTGEIPFVSSDQIITTAGPLTLAHGLGVEPKRLFYFLICQIAEQGYLVGNIVPLNPMGVFVQNTFMTMVIDKTNLNIRYGSAVNVFRFLNINTGNGATVTDASWKVRFIALP